MGEVTKTFVDFVGTVLVAAAVASYFNVQAGLGVPGDAGHLLSIVLFVVGALAVFSEPIRDVLSDDDEGERTVEAERIAQRREADEEPDRTVAATYTAADGDVELAVQNGEDQALANVELRTRAPDGVTVDFGDAAVREGAGTYALAEPVPAGDTRTLPMNAHSTGVLEASIDVVVVSEGQEVAAEQVPGSAFAASGAA